MARRWRFKAFDLPILDCRHVDNPQTKARAHTFFYSTDASVTVAQADEACKYPRPTAWPTLYGRPAKLWCNGYLLGEALHAGNGDSGAVRRSVLVHVGVDNCDATHSTRGSPQNTGSRSRERNLNAIFE